VDAPRRQIVRAEVDERADGPTASAISGSLIPFCSETTNPSGASRGASAAIAARVCWCLTASRTAPRPSGSSSGETARTGTVNCSSGPSSVSPCSFMAATCAGSASQNSTSWPARASRAPTVPPIAPAPATT
jgi:hypothetical protein